jgi:hypothetical protein
MALSNYDSILKRHYDNVKSLDENDPDFYKKMKSFERSKNEDIYDLRPTFNSFFMDIIPALGRHSLFDNDFTLGRHSLFNNDSASTNGYYRSITNINGQVTQVTKIQNGDNVYVEKTYPDGHVERNEYNRLSQ